MPNAKLTEPRIPRQAIDGVLLLDKPVGLSSHSALQRARFLLNAAKGGHTGTLDPFASGLLPVCLGEATKFAQFQLEADKTYVATLRLGITTTTGDPEGDVLETRPVHARRDHLLALLPRYRGEITQVPPMYSALKHQGKPLYEYARAGIVIERPARRVRISTLELTDWGDGYCQLRVGCSAGTYIRTLAEDIGNALGCGAHLTALRRVASGGWQLSGAVDLDTLAALPAQARTARLLPVDALLGHLPRQDLDATLSARLRLGQRLVNTGEPGMCRVYGPEGFLGIADCDHVIRPRRLLGQSTSST
jgi:tRNA pseudouridine55 synthase